MNARHIKDNPSCVDGNRRKVIWGRFRKVWIALIISLVFLLGFGCAVTLAKLGVILARPLCPSGGVELLNANVDSDRLGSDSKALSLFSLFAHHLPPGSDAGKVKRVIRSGKWVAHAAISPGGLVNTGRPLLPGKDGYEVFHIQLYHQTRTMGKWTLSVSLKGEGSPDDAIQFLSGGKSGFTELGDFALSYPSLVIPDGVGRREIYSNYRMYIFE